jgi:hypothetical protein
MGEVRIAYKSLVGKPEGKRPLGRTRCRKEENVRMDLGEIWCEDVDWMHVAQDRDQWRSCGTQRFSTVFTKAHQWTLS